MAQYKKILFLSGIIYYSICFIPFTSRGEERAGALDFFIATGFGFPIGGHLLDSTSQTFKSVSDATPYEVEDHYLNYGFGIKADAGVNYLLTNYLGMRFTVSYTGGIPPIHVEVKYEDNDNAGFTEKYKRNMFGFNVMLLPRFELFELFDMYGGPGIGLFFAFLKRENNNNDGNHEYEGEIRTIPALSFHGLIGTDLPLNDKLTLFGELSFSQMSFKAKSRTDTDKADNIDFNKDSNTSPAPFKIPGSNIALRIGIKMTVMHLAKTPEVY